MRRLVLMVVAALGGVLVWGSSDLTQRGDPDSPAAVHQSVSVYYIRNAYEETRTPNMVTAILADYRSFDTLGESVVVMVAALACVLILMRARRPDERDGGEA